jgi:hypothetical protein
MIISTSNEPSFRFRQFLPPPTASNIDLFWSINPFMEGIWHTKCEMDVLMTGGKQKAE